MAAKPNALSGTSVSPSMLAILRKCVVQVVRVFAGRRLGFIRKGIVALVGRRTNILVFFHTGAHATVAAPPNIAQ
jgi:hypothetical protein